MPGPTCADLPAQLTALVRAMREAATRMEPDLVPPPSFALVLVERGAVVQVIADNGGGEETSHPELYEAELRWDDTEVRLAIPTRSLHLEGLSPTLALARVRELCEEALPPALRGAPPEEAFRCAFCEEPAHAPCPRATVSRCRRCACGAVGLCGPGIDSDEIVDDALALFAVEPSPESAGHDRRMLVDIERAGVEVRVGWEGELPGLGPFGRLLTMWFRRRDLAG